MATYFEAYSVGHSHGYNHKAYALAYGGPSDAETIPDGYSHKLNGDAGSDAGYRDGWSDGVRQAIADDAELG